jgi:hypothetical protein
MTVAEDGPARRKGDSSGSAHELCALVPGAVGGEADVLGPAQSLRTRFTIAGLVIFSIGTLLAWALAQSVVRRSGPYGRRSEDRRRSSDRGYNDLRRGRSWTAGTGPGHYAAYAA